ncbi:MAG TPA: 2-amino-4-hydroxy-6-hydroxymethyldihydropteridine diphosphokinase [Gammaproteobacteria bacterium]|nr:2-amino-4-hydroxy-6-hydroxymethyldihydropteridine diphosphokinase [Gammaproteobacteria bacterium]
MTEVFVGIGSNIEPERHVAAALAALKARFADLRTSTVYRSRAVGFAGNDFLNLVAAFETDLDVHALDEELHRIESDCGRDRTAPRFAPRTIDLDLLLYGDAVLDEPRLKLPRPEVLKYAFVLQPLAELAGDKRHPVTGQTFEQHWRAFKTDEPPLVAVSG